MPLNGLVMSRNTTVATVENGVTIDLKIDLAPYLLQNSNLDAWLRSRVIDKHRVNARLLKKALRLNGADDIDVVLKFNAATITDTYWWRPEGSDLRYEDIRFTANHFDELALRGDIKSINNPESRTPELTNIGSFEKCWRIDGGEWWLHKRGNAAELFSELFISKLGAALGFEMAEYRIEDGCIKSRDFTHGAEVNFEAAEGIVGTNEEYAVNFERFHDLSPELAEQYLRIIYLDTLVFNVDRHTQNYGILRDVETGAPLKMTPNYDNNIALLAGGGVSETVASRDLLVDLYAELLTSDARARTMAARFPTPPRDLVEQCIADTNAELDAPMDAERVCGRVCDIIMNRAAAVEIAMAQTIAQTQSREPEMTIE